jgi:YHS domain-containing protein
MNSPADDSTQHHPRRAIDAAATEIDPVCGMSVDPRNAAGSVSHAGKTFYFCSTHCAQAGWRISGIEHGRPVALTTAEPRFL